MRGAKHLPTVSLIDRNTLCRSSDAQACESGNERWAIVWRGPWAAREVMKKTMMKRFVRASALILLWIAAGGATLAASVDYDYDALGRLKAVRYSDGTVVVYTLDAAGNRTQEGTYIPPSAPVSISVPASSISGSYTIDWGAATGTVTAYQLYEATTSDFSGQVLVHNGSSRSLGISGKTDGAYYYRARACNGSVCGAYVSGGNPVVVSLPGTPASISVPSISTTGSYTISWGGAGGSVTRYELYEATNAAFSGHTLVYIGGAGSAGISGKANHTSYYYRVRACNDVVCSGYQTATNGITIRIPIQVLNPAIQVTCCTTTSITTLANLNGNTGTIQSFSSSCEKGFARIQSGAQGLSWTNDNWFYRGCEVGINEQCSASFVIRNSITGELHSGGASIVIMARGRNPPNPCD